ncbi:MAG: prepilin-type N-terminal cleavage/methylation domain-containing protein [Gemmatimonadota bacterium]
MPSPRPSPRPTAGFTLAELLIAMTMTLVVAGAAWSLFRSQSRSFTSNSDRYDLVQNARGTLEGAERVIRTMGAGSPNNQPVLVYGANGVLAFNTDYIEQDTTDMRWAAYYNPDTPAPEGVAWLQTDASVIPNSSPSYSYPTASYRLGNGALSPAETYIFYFQSDTATSRTDDYILYQRVNNGAPEIVSRNLLPHPSGRPFFEFLMQRQLSSGDTLITVPAGLLPLIRRPLISGISSTDTAAYVRPDSVRAVRMNFRLTNGRTGPDERLRDVSTTIEVPNNGIPLPTVCGRVPYDPPSLSVVDTVPGSGRLWFTWSSSVDQDTGEQDVTQYILYRRPASSSTWSDPLVVVRAEDGKSSYNVQISDNVPGTPYTFGVAAQDCTPAQSTIRTLNVTPTP